MSASGGASADCVLCFFGGKREVYGLLVMSISSGSGAVAFSAIGLNGGSFDA